MAEHWGRRDSAACKHDEDKDPGDGNFQTIRDHGHLDSCSQPEWISIGDAMRSTHRKRSYGFRLLEPDIGVKLLCEHGLKIVAEELAFRSIDNADPGSS